MQNAPTQVAVREAEKKRWQNALAAPRWEGFTQKMRIAVQVNLDFEEWNRNFNVDVILAETAETRIGKPRPTEMNQLSSAQLLNKLDSSLLSSIVRCNPLNVLLAFFQASA